MSRAATQNDYARSALRIPRELHAEIHAAAKAKGCSFNAEIISRLQARPMQDRSARIFFDLAQIKSGITRLLAKD